MRAIQIDADSEISVADAVAFPVETGASRAKALREAVAYRKAGGRFYTADELMAQMRTAIEESAGVALSAEGNI